MHIFPKVRITADNRLGTKRIGITESLGKRLSLQDNGQLVVGVGKRRIPYVISLQPGNNDTVFLHTSSIRQLCLIPNQDYGYVYQAGELRLGPMVGIMIEVLGGPGRLFAGQTTFIKSLISRGQELGEICYAFSPYAIDWQRQLVTGYTYRNGKWVKQSFPFPDVVYPRERTYAYSRIIVQIRQRFSAMGIKFLNPQLAGKWVTYQTIHNHPQLRAFVPDTRLLTSFHVVEAMVKKYRTVYLKPVIGSKGQNIIRITRNSSNNLYQFQYQRSQKAVRGTATSLGQLRASLRPVMGKREYLVQQGIKLLTFQGHITDVRAIVQKDHTGQWMVTAIGCRMGPAGSITSNLASGGRGAKLSTILEKHFPSQQQRDQIERDIRFVALESARVLENTIGTAGEMGVDLGIDVNGKIWFIEANLRPARRLFRLIDETESRQQSIVNPMLYSRYLAGFSGKEYDECK
ncbi:MAG TPA: YheC/YheD family protein [Syntrophomonadaceae bacterium]|nr:YheC/YheD family protein [Syntrophomonadaceae bacterium]HOQ10025.1 YheC/YheD family protein [Syntrophomonadaceae bacterium]HPU49020.1 YheC/YheD family protein [Syntrophomonadaceae bacterium]